MVLGTGIDVVEVSRFQRELQASAWLASQGVFRGCELQYCYATTFPHKRFAAVFAAKEAAAKALGIGAPDLGGFNDIEIGATSNGHFTVQLHGQARQRYLALGAERILTAWHVNRYIATAMVVLEG